jgi:hypothetical protein
MTQFKYQSVTLDWPHLKALDKFPWDPERVYIDSEQMSVNLMSKFLNRPQLHT